MSVIARSASAEGKYGLASMKVNRAGRAVLYVSLDYVPLRKPLHRVRYRLAVREHLLACVPWDEAHAECPNHPIPPLRRRHRIA